MWYFLLGVLIGWITKTPWLKKLYREMKERQEHLEQLYNNIKNLDYFKGK